MRNIEPIVFTTDGPLCTQIKVWGVYDEYDNEMGWCQFAWTLFTEEGAPVDTGQMNCTGEDYIGWDGNNDFPYTWVAANLHTPVTIINE